MPTKQLAHDAESADKAATELEEELRKIYEQWLEDLGQQLEGEEDPDRRREIIAAALLLLKARIRNKAQSAAYELAAELGADEQETEAILGEVANSLDIFGQRTLERIQTDLERAEPAEVEDRNRGKAAWVALIGGILWTGYQRAKFAGRQDDPLVMWVGPDDDNTCLPCKVQVNAGVRPLSQTPLPGPAVCEGLTRCRHDIVEVRI